MIFDKWENLSDLHFSKEWDEIISQVKTLRQENLEEITYDLCHNAYLNVMSFYGKDENVYEAHKKFVDIHFVMRGCERINIAFVSDIEKDKAYNKGDFYQEDKDVIFYTKEYEPHAHIYLDETSFLLAMPKDAHAPCLHGKYTNDNKLEKDGNPTKREKNLKGIIKIPIKWV